MGHRHRPRAQVLTQPHSIPFLFGLAARKPLFLPCRFQAASSHRTTHLAHLPSSNRPQPNLQPFPQCVTIRPRIPRPTGYLKHDRPRLHPPAPTHRIFHHRRHFAHQRAGEESRRLRLARAGHQRFDEHIRLGEILQSLPWRGHQAGCGGGCVGGESGQSGAAFPRHALGAQRGGLPPPVRAAHPRLCGHGSQRCPRRAGAAMAGRRRQRRADLPVRRAFGRSGPPADERP